MSALQTVGDIIMSLQHRVREAKSAFVDAERGVLDAGVHLEATRVAYAEAWSRLKDLSSAITRTAEFQDPAAMTVLQRCPATGLQADCLIEIFHLLVAAHEYESGRRSTVHSPITTLASVSHQWRSIALSSRKLWAKFGITLEHTSPATFARRLTFLLERAGPHLLDMLLVVPDIPDTVVLSKQAVDTLLLAFSRCRAVHIELHDISIRLGDKLLALLLQANMPELRRLHLSQRPLDTGDLRVRDAPEQLHLFVSSPKLTYLDLGLIPFRFIDTSSMPSIRFARLLGYINEHDLVNIARDWTDLRHLDIEGVRIQTRIARNSSVLSKLETLKCHCTGRRHNIFELLTVAHLPRLRELHMHCMNTDAPDFFAKFLNSAPWTSLTSLSLAGQAVSIFLPNIRLLPNLASLELHSVTRNDLSSLLDTWKEGHTQRPRKLESLGLIECELGGGNMPRLVAFLAQRKANAAHGDTSITHLSVVQRGCYPSRDDICRPEALERLGREVANVVLDTGHAHVQHKSI